jgi:arabinofuranosyltransferase
MGRDAVALSALLVLTAALLFWVYRQGSLPFEDAAMLLRYAEHFAQGHGIVWNVGDKPVDGATDFLFMVIIGGLSWLGFAVETAAALAIGAGHVAGVLAVYVGSRWAFGAGRLLSLLAAAYLALGPALTYAAAQFGAPVFAACAAVSYLLAFRAAREPSLPLALGFAASCLLTSLVRPEGVFLSVFLLLAVVMYRGLSQSKRIVAVFAAVFLLLGGAYFAWRWSYFGHPLPNPFYKKGGGSLYPGGLFHSIREVLGMNALFLPFFALGLVSQRHTRLAAFALIPAVGFSGIWVLLSNEMNFAGRFQYAVMPLLLMTWPRLAEELWRDWELPTLAAFSAASRKAIVLGLSLVITFAFVTLRYSYSTSITNYVALHDLGRMLRPYSERGYTLVTTEAGLLPLYSGWRAIDAWGLNDAVIAHAGGVTEAYLDQHQPELVMFHAYSSPLVPEDEADRLAGWSRMIAVLKRYVATRDYELVAAYGRSPVDTHWYFVKRGFPHAAEITQKIRAMNYDWFGPCVDFARLRPGEPTVDAAGQPASVDGVGTE